MHQKHAKLTKPNYGFFARNEWAIIGTPCGKIQELAYQLIQQLTDSYKVAYVDADHASADQPLVEHNGLSNGAFLEYTDKISHHRFETKATLDTYQYRTYFNEQDVVLVNGNHFKAAMQIVVIDPKKEKSLQKKLDRLTNVQLFLFVEGVTDLPTPIKEEIANWQDIPVVKWGDLPTILALIKKELQKQIAPLNGLVLAGGKSQRMGRDKGLIAYHGKAQREYMADILDELCDHTFLSFRQGQSDEQTGYPVIEDRFLGLGPFGAIASAFLKAPNHAWLVIACDLPLLDQFTLQYLVANRNPSAIATAFNSPVNEFPEPLIAIWEPKSYPILLQFLTQGYSCPRKVLINSSVHLLDAPDGTKLMNVNHPEEVHTAKKLIG